MLVLSRRTNERIRIGDAIDLVVVGICGDRAWLGITAPKELPIHRQEVYEAIRRESDHAGTKTEADAAEARGTDDGRGPA